MESAWKFNFWNVDLDRERTALRVAAAPDHGGCPAPSLSDLGSRPQLQRPCCPHARAWVLLLRVSADSTRPLSSASHVVVEVGGLQQSTPAAAGKTVSDVAELALCALAIRRVFENSLRTTKNYGAILLFCRQHPQE